MNLGVLASHEGTTLQSLIDAFARGRIPGRVSVVVSNNGDSGALVKARQAGVQAVHLSSRTHPDPATLDAAIREVLVAANVDVIFLAGYMKKLGPFVLGTFQGRIRCRVVSVTTRSPAASRACSEVWATELAKRRSIPWKYRDVRNFVRDGRRAAARL
jgi:hypothetical protein